MDITASTGVYTFQGGYASARILFAEHLWESGRQRRVGTQEELSLAVKLYQLLSLPRAIRTWNRLEMHVKDLTNF